MKKLIRSHSGRAVCNASIKNQSRVCAALLAGLIALPATQVFAQGGFEEIIVTGRKREESLQDVPVSISVASAAFIDEAGINSAQSLFDATPGFELDSGWGDRNTAQPGVRGVQGNGLGATQQKMNSFLDGFPVVGQQASLGFSDVSRVELYRGPQSAAFGRATFAGAINYVSRDPSEEFEGNLTLGTSDLGGDKIGVSLAGPLTDTLGFTADFSTEEFEGPDEWISTDGYHLSATRTDYFSTKLVWQPTDAITAKLRYINQKANDRPGNRYYADLTAFNACTNFKTTASTPRNYYRGNVTENCDLSIPAGGITRNHDVVASTPGLVPGSPQYILAQAVSVLDPYARDERERFQLEVDFAIGESSLEILAMDGTEYWEAWQDTDYSAAPANFTLMSGLYALPSSAASMSNPYHSSEQYAEIRWISPVEERMRYMVGATYYDAAVPGEGNTEYAGTLLGLDGVPIIGRAFAASSVYGDGITNTGAFASLAYDYSDRTTIQIEGRYQNDTISNVNNVEGNKVLEKSTKSFSPRLSITHNLESGLTVYGQYAIGTNPGGVNIGYTFDDVAETLILAKAAGDITYDLDTFDDYIEEKLTNMEIGVKGIALDGRLNFSAALYNLKWENQTRIYTVSWGGPGTVWWGDGSAWAGIYDSNDYGQRTTLNEGTVSNSGVEFEGTYLLTDTWSINGSFAVMNVKYDKFCDALITGGNFGFAADDFLPGTTTKCRTMDGQTPTGVPESNYNIGVAYRTDVADGQWNLSARMDLRHAGEQYMDNENIMFVGARDQINGSVSLSNDAWTVRFWGNNLTNDLTPRNVGLGTDYNNWNPALSTATAPRNLVITPTRPREVGLSVGYAF